MPMPLLKFQPCASGSRCILDVHISRIHGLSKSSRLRSKQTTIWCSGTSTAGETPASDSVCFSDSSSAMAMSKRDLEDCQWLKPSTKVFATGSPVPDTSPSSDSTLTDRRVSSIEAAASNGLAASNGSAVHSSRVASAQSSSTHSVADRSPHASPSIHSSILMNALPATRRWDAAILAPTWKEQAENGIERAIFDFRFLSLLAVAGSLAGSFLCFLKGCVFIVESYAAFYVMCVRGEHTGKMVLRLVEAVDVYLTGTVMLIFGMGLYGLFISNIPSNLPPNKDRALRNSSLFGMFLLQERPKWMRIASLDELKTKLGHVVVMILLVKMFERSKAVVIATGADLLSYSVSIFLTSGALLVLRHLHH
ncbi:hypothetical protein KP509_08G030500 [Ceratopteris richardii]|uniref:Uncharacterized protein n=1 Tax=Ceratopteris richardii TaxID=49495 RepID=A0A8T2U5Q2_CERRI|nr:hypothetical protein KP509_08G030500 [Ceratopteris richardii]